jgi:hypothetical protein
LIFESSVEVIFNGMNNHLMSYGDCLHQDISHGSTGAESLILIGTLLDMNPADAVYN